MIEVEMKPRGSDECAGGPAGVASSPRSANEANTATRLLRAVLAKSWLELLFVCGLATFAAFSNQSPLLRGAIDAADERRVTGWAYDPLAPDEAVAVQLFIDDRFAATQTANLKRDDLVAAGAAPQPQHGFTFELAPLRLPPGRHVVQVYAVRRAAGANKSLLPLAKQPRIIEVRR